MLLFRIAGLSLLTGGYISDMPLHYQLVVMVVALAFLLASFDALREFFKEVLKYLLTLIGKKIVQLSKYIWAKVKSPKSGDGGSLLWPIIKWAIIIWLLLVEIPARIF